MVLTSAPSAWTAEDGAALHRLAVEVHRACAAVGRVAADMGAGQPQGVAQQVDEQQTRLDLDLMLLAIDGEAHGNSAHTSPLSLDAGWPEPITSRCSAHKCARGHVPGCQDSCLRRGLAEHDALGGVGGALDERPHLVRGSGASARGRRPTTMSGSVESGRPTPTRTRREVRRAQPAAQGLQAVVARQAAAHARADLAEGQVDLVVDDEHAVELEVQRPARRAGRVAGLVHVGLRAAARRRAGRRGRCGPR